MPTITPCLTFASRGHEAVEFYLSLFPGSVLHHAMVAPGGDQLYHASFTLAGQDLTAMDGGESFTFTTGISLFVSCADQAEVDRLWEALTAGGGQPGRCGWLVDRFGVSWQIVPTALGELMSDSDPATAGRVREAMLQMGKIDVEGLRRAHAGG